MHPIQDFFESFSYVRQIDMQPICTPTLAKFYSCKKWVFEELTIIGSSQVKSPLCRVVPHHYWIITGEESLTSKDAGRYLLPRRGGREAHHASAVVSSITELMLGRSAN
jgi:hypothetical protein